VEGKGEKKKEENGTKEGRKEGKKRAEIKKWKEDREPARERLIDCLTGKVWGVKGGGRMRSGSEGEGTSLRWKERELRGESGERERRKKIRFSDHPPIPGRHRLWLGLRRYLIIFDPPTFVLD